MEKDIEGEGASMSKGLEVDPDDWLAKSLVCSEKLRTSSYVHPYPTDHLFLVISKHIHLVPVTIFLLSSLPSPPEKGRLVLLGRF